MAKVYLGVGHGTKPDGKYDPGAIGAGGEQEHLLAHVVADAAAAVLARAGVSFDVERDSGVGHDPNYVGSVKRINSGAYALAVEVHFDWRGAPRGGFGCFISDKGKSLAEKIQGRYRAAGLDTRANQRRSDLYFLTQTKPVALIFECDRVGAFTRDDLVKMGRAIGEGICAYLGVAVPSETPPPAPKPVPGPSVHVRAGSVEEALLRAYPGLFGARALVALKPEDVHAAEGDAIAVGVSVWGARSYRETDRYATLRAALRGEGVL